MGSRERTFRDGGTGPDFIAGGRINVTYGHLNSPDWMEALGYVPIYDFVGLFHYLHLVYIYHENGEWVSMDCMMSTSM